MMSSQMLRGALAPFIFFTLLTNAALSSSDATRESTCRQQYSNWIHSYGASDPFLAFQKTTPWYLSKRFMNQIIESDAKDLSQNAFISLRPTFKQKPKIVDSDFYDYVNGFSKGTVRNDEIKKNINSFYQQITATDTLLIGYVGLYHAFDFFMTYPNLSITYMHKPFNLKAQFYSPEYLEFSALVGIKNTLDEDVKKWEGFHSATPYAAAYAVAKKINLSALPAHAFDEKVSDFKKILIGEFHSVRSTKLSDQFPDVQCLKNLGITKIQLALEGYSKTETVSPHSAIRRRNFVESFSHYATKNQMTLDQYMQLLKTTKKLPNSIMAQFSSGRIIDNVGMVALLEKLKILSSEGIEIKIVGLESADYTFPEMN